MRVTFKKMASNRGKTEWSSSHCMLKLEWWEHGWGRKLRVSPVKEDRAAHMRAYHRLIKAAGKNVPREDFQSCDQRCSKYRYIIEKENYDKLLNSGMFFEFYPELTGNWEEDKNFF